MRTLRRVAVLGAGTMGSRIAAHFANAGIPALLLDVLLPGQPSRNAAALKGIDAAAKQKPVAFFTGSVKSLITPGNFEDHLAEIRNCDWVVEAVTENLEIKRSLWKRVEALRDPDSIVSTNTSGLLLAEVTKGFSPGFRRHFLGTHFFNPPRYLHLVEVIPGEQTDPEVLDFVSSFCDRRLGKGVVPCKDTPNFIANRIGCFWGATTHKILMEDDYTIEEVDALTGPIIGLPRSASFRLVDIIGLDVWKLVAENLYDAIKNDAWRGRFLTPPFLNEMIARRWLGEKTGQGFYRRVRKGEDRQIHAIDWKTLDYHPIQKPKLPSVEAAQDIPDLPERLRMLLGSTDRAGMFLWKLFSDVFVYAAERIPEISDRIVEVDRVMRWGYAHTLGPFEIWDALGFEAVVERMERDHRELPPSIQRMLSSGAKSFYRPADRNGRPRTEYFDLLSLEHKLLEERPAVLVLADVKRARGVVKQNAGASLVDLGDGVLCLEFHSKMNTLGEDQISMIYAGIGETERNFRAMVIANQGENFSAGANLTLILRMAQEGDWNEFDALIRRVQQAFMAIKYAARPVVAAPFRMTLGGGCEIALHAARVQASAELYMGLPETGAGLIPAGGGCKEMLLRKRDPMAVFGLIGSAKISTSAADARELSLLRPVDAISMNPERLIGDAKRAAIALAEDYAPGAPRTDIAVSGESGFAAMKLAAWTAHQGHFISEYDLAVGEKLARVLSGGCLTGSQTVSEQYLLDLEREAFLSLCGQPKTQERIQHLLKTGKPLRN